MKNFIYFILFFSLSTFAQEQLTNINTLTGNNSYPIFIAKIGNKTFFTAQNNELERKLWVTDGTDAGTTFIKGIVPENFSSYIKTVVKDNFLYFIIWDTKEVWRTDGTESGTVKVLEIVNDGESQSVIIDLVANETYFAVIAQYYNDGKTIVKKYNYDFKLISTETANLSLSNPFAFGNQIIFDTNIVFSNGLNTTSYYESLLYNLSTSGHYVDNEYVYSGWFEQKYIIGNKLNSIYQSNYQYNPNNGGGYLIEYDGTNAQRYNLLFAARKGYTLNMLKSFVYNNQVFVAMIGTNKDYDGAFGSVIEVYAFKPDIGFELKLNYFAEQQFSDISNFWADGQNIHFLSTRYEDNNQKLYHHELNYISTQFKNTKIVNELDSSPIKDNGKGLLVIQKYNDNNSGFLFDYKTNKITPLTPTIRFESFGFEQSNNKWLINASNIYTGYEPHLLDISTGNISLIKDINTNGTGIGQINETNIIDNKLVWATIEKDGIIVNKSDGTKAGTSALKTITVKNLASVKNDYTFSIMKARQVENTIIFDYNYNPKFNCWGCIAKYKHVSFASDGTASNTIKLYDSDTVLNNYVSTKINKNYYDVIDPYSISNKKIQKYDLNGNLTGVVKEYSYQNYSYQDYFNGYAITEKYFVTPGTFNRSFDVVDFTTGKTINTETLNYVTNFNNKILLKETNPNNNQQTVYLLNEKNNTPVKLFTMNLDDYFNTQQIGNELFFFGDKSTIFVVDSLVQGVQKIPLVIPGSTNRYISAIKKFNNSYLIIQSSYDETSDKRTFRWQLTSNGVSVELPNAPQTNLSDNSIIISDAMYFSASSYFDSKFITSIYRFDGKTIKLAGYLEDPKFMSLYELPNAIIFKTSDNKILYWTPTGVEDITPVKLNSNPISFGKIGKKALLLITNNNGSRSLYATDGTKKRTVFLQNSTDLQLYQTKVINNKLYYTASTEKYGNEPWETDGTPEGTKMVADLMAGPASSDPTHFTDLNGTPICLAATPNLGKQIFSLKAIEQPNLTADKVQVCEGNKITLSAPADYQGYIWVSGKDSVKTTANTFLVTKSGSYQVLVENFGTKSAASKAVALTVTPFPEKPSINVAANGLEVLTNAMQIQWLLNGQEISGEIGKTLKNYGSGAYSVRVSTNGCETTSDVFAITASENETSSELKAFPNPSTNILNVSFKPQTNTFVELIDASGHQSFQKMLNDQSSSLQINVGSFTKGVYLLKVNNAVKKVVVE
jgi:ELWxxDGT repeat protein